MPNQELFRKIHDQIVLHPEQHAQHVFESHSASCGTRRCVAGWAIFLHHNEGKPVGQWRDGEDIVYSLNTSFDAEGARLLGLSELEANVLFYNTSDRQATLVAREFAETGASPALDERIAEVRRHLDEEDF